MKKRNIRDFSIRKLDLSSYKVKFLDKYRIWFAVPIVVVLVAIIMFSIFAAVGKDFSEGMNLGIDFTGGTIMEVKIGSDLEDGATYDKYSQEIGDMVESYGFKVGYIQKTGSGEDSALSVKYQNKDADLEESNQKLKDDIATKYSNITADDISLTSMSASSAKDLLDKAFISLAVIFVVMLVYIAIRFELWSGISALLALIHDVIMMIAFTIIFHIEVNTTYVAAVITIVAYSINNTIIVFDRIREMMRLAPKGGKVPLGDYTEQAVNDTFTRSAVSTVTTMIPVFLLGCFGEVSLQQFAWPIMFGLIAGTYSSLILAPTVYVLIRNAISKSKEKKYVAAQAGEKQSKQNRSSAKSGSKAANQLTDVLRERNRNKN